MDADFWHEKWASKDIAFHNSDAHPLLVAYMDALELAPGGRVFIPLCGKSRDIAWLRSQGLSVAAVELSRIAVEELFAELGLEPQVETLGSLRHYSGGEGLDIYQGDIFDLCAAQLGCVDAVYDRAALVALPEAMRQRYSHHVRELGAGAPQLLIVYDYLQSAMAGPPFAIGDAEVAEHYSDSHTLQLLHSEAVAGGLKGQCPAEEKVWLLRAGR